MQKRKYGTATSILGQHKEISELENRDGAIEYLLEAVRKMRKEKEILQRKLRNTS